MCEMKSGDPFEIWQFRIFRLVLFIIFLVSAYELLDSHTHIGRFVLSLLGRWEWLIIWGIFSLGPRTSAGGGNRLGIMPKVMLFLDELASPGSQERCIRLLTSLGSSARILLSSACASWFIVYVSLLILGLIFWIGCSMYFFALSGPVRKSWIIK